VSLLDPCQCTWNVKERAATEAAALSAFRCESSADKERHALQNALDAHLKSPEERSAHAEGTDQACSQLCVA